MEILLSKTVHSISTNMYYALFTKILQGWYTASETVLHKKVFKNLLLKPFTDTLTKSF